MRLLLPLCLVFIHLGFGFGTGGANETEETQAAIAKLKRIWVGKLKSFKCDRFIDAARELHKLGQSEAIKCLGELRPDDDGLTTNLILCNMLFEHKNDSSSRMPRLGEAGYLGGTSARHWSQEPIVLVDGVPFLIARGYARGVFREDAAKRHVQWFVKNCKWREKGFSIATRERKQKALKTLIETKTWVKPLEDYEIKFLNDQIE